MGTISRATKAEWPTRDGSGTAIFLHIPRTGGTALTRVARRQFPRDSVYVVDSRDPAGSMKALDFLPAADRNRIRLVMGHVDFGAHRHVSHAIYFTLVRDPVERVVSAYRYARARPTHSMHEVAMSRTLREMIESEVWLDLSNCQCRAISGREIRFGEQPADVLETAKANLGDRFSVVGLTERFEETLLLLRHELGWRRLWHAAENTGRGPASVAELSDEDLDAVTHVNRLDIELYGHLRSAFQQRLDASVPDWERRLARLRLENAIVRPGMRLRVRYEEMVSRRHERRTVAAEPSEGPASNGPGL